MPFEVHTEADLDGKGAPPQPRPLVLTVADVMALKVEPRCELIEKWLPTRGACLIFGKPKSNKTTIAVQAAIAVATGQAFLDYYKVLKTGPVLLLTQDDPDGAASVQDLFRVSPIPTHGQPIYTVPKVPFDFGVLFIEWLEKEIVEKKLVFAVLDSYTKLRGPRKSGIDIVKAESADLTELDELAKRTNCCILIIHHDSKSAAAALDWSDHAAGTYAMSSSTENQIHMARFSDLLDGAPERLVQVRGRHTRGNEVVVRFREKTLDQEFILEGGAAPLYPMILGLRNSFGSEPFTPKEYKFETGVSSATATRHIARLLQSDALIRTGKGSYKLSITW